MLRLYDTASRKVLAVSANRRGEVRIYACGPAAGRPAGLSDLRACLLPDLITRTLERRQLLVTLCRRVPDAGPGIAPPAAGQHEERLLADLAALNVRPAEYSPRTSESEALIVDMISGLLGTGHAYARADGSVWFDARSFPSLGQLRGAGGITDWKLWHGRADRGAWWAPWGPGLPGAHVDCAAIALHFIGWQVEVRAGSIAECFPYHEHESAICDAVPDHQVVQQWAHAGLVRAAGEIRLGDFAGRGLDPLAARLAFLGHGYRQEMELSWGVLGAADATLRRWRESVAGWAQSPSGVMPAAYVDAVIAAFEDDLDTPAALRCMETLERDDSVPPGARFEAFAYLDQLLGLDLARDVGKL